VTITYSGLEALWRRIDERNEDDANRKKFLEDQVKEYIPLGSEVELTNKPEWATPAMTMVAEYDVKVPGWAAATGKRVLVPSAIFSNTEKHLFEHADRTHPIYFSFPFKKVDDVTIEMPLGWKVSSTPKPTKEDAKVLTYELNVDQGNGTLHLKRQLDMQLMILDVKYYPALRDFFQKVRTADEQQIVVQPSTASASQ
jgi:hypothetical protein